MKNFDFSFYFFQQLPKTYSQGGDALTAVHIPALHNKSAPPHHHTLWSLSTLTPSPCCGTYNRATPGASLRHTHTQMFLIQDLHEDQMKLAIPEDLQPHLHLLNLHSNTRQRVAWMRVAALNHFSWVTSLFSCHVTLKQHAYCAELSARLQTLGTPNLCLPERVQL